MCLVLEMFRILKSVSVLHINTFQPSVRRISVNNTFLKKLQFSDIDPEASVILLSGENKTVMKFSEVMEKMGKKQLVRVTPTKKKSEIPMFQLMSETDLEVATKKAKSISSTFQGSKLIFGKNQH